MRIVNREEFLCLPEGVLFATYHPCVFGPLNIKRKTILNDMQRDFFYTPVSGVVVIDWESTNEMVYMCSTAVEKGISLPTCVSTHFRWGLFDEGQLFAVWETSDLQGLNSVLSECIGGDVLPTPRDLSSLMEDTADAMLDMLRNTTKISVDSAVEADVKDFVSRLLLSGKLPAEYYLGKNEEE